MYRKTVILSVLFAIGLGVDPQPESKAAASSSPPPKVVQIKSYEASFQQDGNYHFAYESEDGSKAVQDGESKQIDKNNTEVVAHGSYSYKGDDGKDYSVSYVADENGYQPQGEHLPQAPPVPPLIQRALDYLATAPPPKEEPTAKSNVH